METKPAKVRNELTRTKVSLADWRDKLSKPKIYELTQKQVAEGLFSIFPMIGATEDNIPDPMEFPIIFNSIISMHGDLTMDEIHLAFKLAMKRDINYDLNLYNKPFNVEFLSGLISKYNEYKRSSFVYRLAYEDSNPRKSDKLSEKQLFNIMNKNCEDYFAAFKKDMKLELDYMFWTCYNHLKKKQNLFEVTDKDIKEAVDTYPVKNYPEGLSEDSIRKERRVKSVLVWNYFTSLYQKGEELNLKSYKEFKNEQK